MTFLQKNPNLNLCKIAYTQGLLWKVIRMNNKYYVFVTPIPNRVLGIIVSISAMLWSDHADYLSIHVYIHQQMKKKTGLRLENVCPCQLGHMPSLASGLLWNFHFHFNFQFQFLSFYDGNLLCFICIFLTSDRHWDSISNHFGLWIFLLPLHPLDSPSCWWLQIILYSVYNVFLIKQI